MEYLEQMDNEFYLLRPLYRKFDRLNWLKFVRKQHQLHTSVKITFTLKNVNHMLAL